MSVDADMPAEADTVIARGTGNVFADLGYPDAGMRQMKLRLAYAMNGVVARRPRADFGIDASVLLSLRTYKLERLSIYDLENLLSKLQGEFASTRA